MNASLEKGKVGYRILLIGDAGDSVERENGNLDKAPVLGALKYFAGFIPDRTAVVFLGDNIYPGGLPDATGQSLRKDEDSQNRVIPPGRFYISHKMIAKLFLYD